MIVFICLSIIEFTSVLALGFTLGVAYMSYKPEKQEVNKERVKFVQDPHSMDVKVIDIANGYEVGSISGKDFYATPMNEIFDEAVRMIIEKEQRKKRRRKQK